MVSNRLLLGVVAFGVSFGIGFLSHRNANRALLTSLITLPATYAAAIIVDKRRKNRELLVLTSQRHQIQQLEAEEINLNRILSQANAKKQELEVSIHYLLSEHHRLHNQTEIERNYKLDLQREIASLKTQQQENENKLESLHININELEQHKQALSQVISHTLAEKESLEQIVLNLQSEAMQFNAKLSDKTEQEKILNQQISNLKQQIQSNKAIIEQQRSQQHKLQAEINKLQFNHAHINTIYQTEQAIEALQTEKKQLELKTYTQQNQLENLEQRQTEIENSLTILKKECEATKSNLRSLQIKKEQQQDELLALQAERNQLQSQILEFQNQIEALIAPPITEDQCEDSDFPLAELIDSLDSPSEVDDHLDLEWLDFIKHLHDDEIEIINAILTQNNPNKIIKKVAESKITMPALLLDKINQYALETIGDSIIDMNSEPIQIIEDYQDAVSKLVQVYENTMSNSCN